ncbi:MAG: esterase-like activity of phytase family protein [Ferruginibacter sp.]
MQKSSLRLLLIGSIVLFSISCTTSKRTTQITANINSLKYLGGYEIPFNLKYKNTIVGGLSGIDYDPENDLYYFISDDRSEKAPARFYAAKIYLTPKGIDSLIFIDVRTILQANGNTYPNNKADKYKTPDPEAIRYNPKTGLLAWSSEGERIVKTNDTVLINPGVFLIDKGGKYIDSFILPANLKMQLKEKGPRRNSVFEGITYADNYKTLYVSVEEPLYEDGPRADVVDNNAFIRIIKFNATGPQGPDSKKCIAQYAYKLEPVAYPAKPKTEFKINGVSDILSLGNNKLLIMERSFSTGRLPCTIKVFLADLNGATDISAMSLEENQPFTRAEKTLILNMDDLGVYTDNIEGVTFGPVLPNGHKTLLFIADNNFTVLEKAQVLLFEILE